MDETGGMSWLLTNAALWPKLSDFRKFEIKVWLEMNGINPRLVPIDTTIMLVVADPETDRENWTIQYEEFCTDADGHILADANHSDEAYAHKREVPLVVDPPIAWLIPV